MQSNAAKAADVEKKKASAHETKGTAIKKNQAPMTNGKPEIVQLKLLSICCCHLGGAAVEMSHSITAPARHRTQAAS